MAVINSGIVVSISEYRPCIVKRKDGDKKALFHRWSAYSEIHAPSPMVSGHPGGVVCSTLGIVEYDDGTVEEVFPVKIMFCDNKFKKYVFKGDK